MANRPPAWVTAACGPPLLAAVTPPSVLFGGGLDRAVLTVQLRRVQGVRSGAGAAATWNRLIVHGPSGRRRLAARLVDGRRLDPRKPSAAVARLAPDVRVDR